MAFKETWSAKESKSERATEERESTEERDSNRAIPRERMRKPEFSPFLSLSPLLFPSREPFRSSLPPLSRVSLSRTHRQVRHRRGAQLRVAGQHAVHHQRCRQQAASHLLLRGGVNGALGVLKVCVGVLLERRGCAKPASARVCIVLAGQHAVHLQRCRQLLLCGGGGF